MSALAWAASISSGSSMHDIVAVCDNDLEQVRKVLSMYTSVSYLVSSHLNV